jgi:phosphoribosylanthranilate isomerase
MIRVKICGNVTLKDTMAAVEAGADAVGFVFHAKSPRGVSPKAVAAIVSHLPPLVTSVGVFVNEKADVVRQIVSDCGLAYAQLHGDESPQYCAELRVPVLKGIRVRGCEDVSALASYRVKAILLDAYVEGLAGGTGATFDWSLAVEAKAWGPIILAGGLTPDNVAEAISHVQPYGVDVSSGVEAAPGMKDHAKVRAFVENVKCWGA